MLESDPIIAISFLRGQLLTYNTLCSGYVKPRLDLEFQKRLYDFVHNHTVSITSPDMLYLSLIGLLGIRSQYELNTK